MAAERANHRGAPTEPAHLARRRPVAVAAVGPPLERVEVVGRRLDDARERVGPPPQRPPHRAHRAAGAKLVAAVKGKKDKQAKLDAPVMRMRVLDEFDDDAVVLALDALVLLAVADEDAALAQMIAQRIDDLVIEELERSLGPQTAGIMLTNPSTVGVFERRIRDIADRVGSSREMVSKILKDLRVGGYLAVEQKRIVLLRPLPEHW